jgi:hypothetical protein
MFKVGTYYWVKKCSRSSMMIQKEMQKEIETKIERRTQRSTSGKPLQRSSPWG